MDGAGGAAADELEEALQAAGRVAERYSWLLALHEDHQGPPTASDEGAEVDEAACKAWLAAVQSDRHLELLSASPVLFFAGGRGGAQSNLPAAAPCHRWAGSGCGKSSVTEAVASSTPAAADCCGGSSCGSTSELSTSAARSTRSLNRSVPRLPLPPPPPQAHTEMAAAAAADCSGRSRSSHSSRSSISRSEALGRGARPARAGDGGVPRLALLPTQARAQTPAAADCAATHTGPGGSSGGRSSQLTAPGTSRSALGARGFVRAHDDDSVEALGHPQPEAEGLPERGARSGRDSPAAPRPSGRGTAACEDPLGSSCLAASAASPLSTPSELDSVPPEPRPQAPARLALEASMGAAGCCEQSAVPPSAWRRRATGLRDPGELLLEGRGGGPAAEIVTACALEALDLAVQEFVDQACSAQQPPPLPPRSRPAAVGGKGASCGPPHQVLLNTYDLSPAVARLNEGILKHANLGAFHCAVEVLEEEWFFGWGPGCASGVSRSRPRMSRQHIYRESIDMGETPLTKNEIAQVICDAKEAWPASSYHPITRNCTHFAEELLLSLLAPEPFPLQLRGAADAAALAPPLLLVLDAGWNWYKNARESEVPEHVSV